MSTDQEVEVLAGDQWCFGVLRAWHFREDTWWASVTYSPAPGNTRVEVVLADRVRRLIYCPWYRGRHQCLGWDDCQDTATPE